MHFDQWRGLMTTTRANNSGVHATKEGQPFKMSHAIPVCSRCDKPMTDNAFALALEKQLSDSVPRDLRLCPRCTMSFESWYRRRGRSSSNLAGVHSEGSSKLATAFGSKNPKRSNRRNEQRHRVLVVTTLTILAFLLVFSWTWTILKSVARLED